MNSILSYDAFRFVEINLNKYHYTDNRGGSPHHYIAIMNKGRCRLVSDNRVVEVSEGEVFYIPMGLPYQSYWYGDSEISFVSLGFRLFPEANDKSFCLQKFECNARIKEKIQSITLNKPVNSHNLCDFFDILRELLPIMETEKVNRNEQIYKKAKRFITQNTACSAKDIAKHCNVSESTLYLAFKTAVNKTPNEVKSEILCDKAVFLLSTTDKSVQEISDALGFSSTSYFRKTLKAYIGHTPREIRKRSVY